MKSKSLLEKNRLKYQPHLPPILQNLELLKPVFEKKLLSNQVDHLFPETAGQPIITFEKKENGSHLPIKVGVVLSGGQAPGGHNVIAGLFDALKKLNPDSQLIGFCDGPSGILKNKAVDITEELLADYRNQGGFDLIGSGRTKIESSEDLAAAHRTLEARNLDALVIIGGDDSNTNAALLAEYLKKVKSKKLVIGVPKTIDGDLKNEFVEISFGFDTACKVYSEMIGNIARDALSAKKYYYFIRLMGRSASHITLECALQTHPNFVLIGEQVEQEKKTLHSITQDIVQMIVQRSSNGKNYGVILIPEGIIEFIPEFKKLISELNGLLSGNKIDQQKLGSLKDKEKIKYIEGFLTEEAAHCFQEIPDDICQQLLLERDPHGNVQVSRIESERLFIEIVQKELDLLKQQGKYKGKFTAQPCFYGYEGRSALPSNFDADYCYTLGYVAALLIDAEASGYLCYVRNLASPVDQWTVGGVPLVSLLHMEERSGKEKPVIKKALVDLAGPIFTSFKQLSPKWMDNDDYCYPGPIQFDGPAELTDSHPIILS